MSSVVQVNCIVSEQRLHCVQWWWDLSPEKEWVPFPLAHSKVENRQISSQCSQRPCHPTAVGKRQVHINNGCLESLSHETLPQSCAIHFPYNVAHRDSPVSTSFRLHYSNNEKSKKYKKLYDIVKLVTGLAEASSSSLLVTTFLEKLKLLSVSR